MILLRQVQVCAAGSRRFGRTELLESALDTRKSLREAPYSFETFPSLYIAQSTLPLLTFQSSPRVSLNSACVKPGGSLLTTILSLVLAGFEIKPSESCPLLLCVADAGIESTPFEREGRAIVTRGAGAADVMTAATFKVPGQNVECQLGRRIKICYFVVHLCTLSQSGTFRLAFIDSLTLIILRIVSE